MVEHVLLHYSGIAFISMKRKAVFIMCSKYLLYMGVYREGIQVMKAKNTDTVSHLFTYAMFSHKFLLCLLIGKANEAFRHKFPLYRLKSKSMYIFIPVTQTIRM